MTTSSRDWPEDFSHENGNYQCQCCHCGNFFNGHKRRVTCKLCTTTSPSPELIRYAVNRIKSMAILRIPNYEQPADSFIEQAVRDILQAKEKERS